MVSAMKGVLLECDIPTKQYLLHLNDEMANSEKFVIYDLDDTHLFVQSTVSEFLEEKLQRFHDQNTYVAAQN